MTSTSNGNIYSYDQNGNQTSRRVGGTTYTLIYDAENRLVQVKLGRTTQATYTYDGDGNRVKTVVGSTTTAFVGNILEWTGSATTMKKYYYASGQRVAMRQGSSTLYYLLTDHLGSTAVTATSGGGISAELRYYPWGGTRYSSGTTPTSFRYTGQREAEVGLYYYGARYYDPQLGRFVSPDTLIPNPRIPIAFDRYAYVQNSPIRYTDPTGHLVCSDPNVADGDCSDQAGYWRYGITFAGNWSSRDRAVVMQAVRDVGSKFSETLGGSAWDAFRDVYGTMTFSMGCSVEDCGDQGGMTLSGHHITFSTLDPEFLRARNNVVHELGHAFNNRLSSLPEEALGKQQMDFSGFPNRPDFPDPVPEGWYGKNYGFASEMNIFTWQQSYALAGSASEEFADQFLGWTYETWEIGRDIGGLSEAGYLRSFWMNQNMPGWINVFGE